MGANHCVRSFSKAEPITQSYDHARSMLAIANLALVLRDATTEQLRLFITAALQLHDACSNEKTAERPIDVLFWLRQRLKQEANKPEKDEFFRAQCLREVSKVEKKIGAASVELSRGKLTILE